MAEPTPASFVVSTKKGASTAGIRQGRRRRRLLPSGLMFPGKSAVASNGRSQSMVWSGGGTGAISHGRRLADLASSRGGEVAIVSVGDDGAEKSITWDQLESRSNQVARRLQELGAHPGAMIAVVLPNSIEHFVLDLAVWKIGGCVLPVNREVPLGERNALLSIARAGLIIGDWERFSQGLATLPDHPLPDMISRPGVAIGTGGSTGRPKIVVDPKSWSRLPGRTAWLEDWAGLKADQVQLVVGPMYHDAPFKWSHLGLFHGHRLVVMEHFEAGLAIELVERHRVNFAFMVPLMMGQIAKLPGVGRRDLSSLDALFHSAAPCPRWVKHSWIDLLGSAAVREAFGSTELVGVTIIGGEEWLQHPGSVGRPFCSELRLLDESGSPVPIGEIGEIYMRRTDTEAPTYRYIGAPEARQDSDGFTSLGDMGALDADGYLHLADRRGDVIISSGARIYPAEVEAALSEHPAIVDAAVVGLPDPVRGQTVHAMVQPGPGRRPPSALQLSRHCGARVASYKVPLSFEMVERLPRNEAGKLRRADLVRQRE
ncbi:MAG: AMP-binding protein [Candidatus Dormibacteria bacterium]